MAKLKSTVIDDTGGLKIPTGTTAQRTIIAFKDVGTTSWTAPAGITKIQVLVVAGGGGGAGGATTYDGNGGGGGGGLIYNSAYAVTPGSSYTVTVGAGGAGGGQTAGSRGSSGGNSVFGTLTAIGGGGGGSDSNATALSGGSGGGAGTSSTNSSFAGGAGTSGQGYAGGGGGPTGGGPGGGGGGGGGAGGPGGINGQNTAGGDGGPGILCAISGIPTWYAGGGGGSSWTNGGGLGGPGGGGNGASRPSAYAATTASANTGGGGGAGTATYSSTAGGSGIVIISFSTEVVEIFSAPGVTTTWTAPAGVDSVEVLVVGGGGSGGRHSGGGGGAGGVIYNPSFAVTPGASYTVTVGAGGYSSGLIGSYPTIAGGVGTNGGNSQFGSLVAIGGGGGGYYGATGNSGGSGGGSARALGNGGTATTGQGYAGGYSNVAPGSSPDTYPAAGGGGAGGIGRSPTATYGGDGGPGLPFNITGVTKWYAGGGGGNIQEGTYLGGAGGLGGGGRGASSINIESQYGWDGEPGTGGGGGGSHYNSPAVPSQGRAGRGGSGIVVIRYNGAAGQASGGKGAIRVNTTTGALEFTSKKPGTNWATVTQSNEITTSGLFFHVDANNPNSKVFYPTKLLNDNVWTLGQGSVGQFNINGAYSENYRVADTDPWGRRSLVWECRSSGDNGGDGGWDSNSFTIDVNVPLRFTEWIRRTVIGSGSSYVGTQNVLNTSDRSLNGNPYFWATGWPFQQNQWYFHVAHVFQSNRPSGQPSLHPNSGFYTVEGGRFYKVASSQTDYIINSNSLNHRTYLYYSSDSITRQQFFRPRVDPLDGSEPSLEALLTDQPVDSNIWYDVQSRNDLIMYNGVGYDPANGGSLTFNGSNQYASTQLPVPVSFNNGGSVEAWIYVGARDRNHGFFQMVTSPSYVNFYMNTANTLRWEVIGNTGSSYTTCWSTTVFEVGKWYHVVGTFGGTQTDLYINGVRESGLTGYTNWPTSYTTNILIGEYGGYWNGKVAATRVYGRPLTATEVQQNFNATRGRFGI